MNQTGRKVQAAQHINVYIAYVTDNCETNPTLTKDQIKFRVPHLGNDVGFPPGTFDGRGLPPVGTECVVSFEGIFSNNPRVLAFNNWQAPPIMFYQTSEPDRNVQNVQPGDLWIQP